MSKFNPRNTSPPKRPSRRAVPVPLAPERCIQFENSVSADHIVLVAVDLTGVVRMKVELAREDVSSWIVKVLRHWLAWCYGASEIRIVS